MLKQEAVIKRFKDAHGDYYDYSQVVYKGAHTPVKIICPVHGAFEQSPHHHWRGRGCQACGAKRAAKMTRGVPRGTTEQFIEKARAVHGSRYDYSRVKYTGTFNKVEIVCKEHGPFFMTPTQHLKGSGCRKCGLENRKKGVDNHRTVPLEDFLARLKNVHKGRYIVDTATYNGVSSKVRVKCRQHGWFYITGKALLLGQGCRKCAEIGKTRRSRKRPMTTKQFIERAKCVWGDTYDYTKVRYRGPFAKVFIRCKEHGLFAQAPNNHLRGSGCPACAKQESKAERALRKLLGGRKGTRVLGGFDIDVWMPEHNVGIEYHGAMWHSTQFRQDKYTHRKKADEAEKRGIRLLQIFDFEYNSPTTHAVFMDLVRRAMHIRGDVVHARKCTLHCGVNVKEFLVNNHMQGPASGTTYALLHDGDIVAALVVRKRFGRLEIIRYAEACGLFVAGGLERLFAAFIRAQNPKEVVSFVDRRFFTGSRFLRLGFELEAITPPNYWYVDKGGKPLGDRLRFQKHLLPKFLGPLFDRNLTEEENMKRAGYYRLYDAGHKKLVWRR